MTWHTFLGGSGNECSTSRCGIAADADGNAFVVGDSPSGWGDDPVLEYSGADDAFVARVEAGDGALIAHTFLGSSDGTDRGYSIAVSNGSVYVAGESDDSWGASPIRAYYSSSDAFAAKLSTGLELTWNTFLGGHDPDSGYAIAVDSAGKVYVAGESGSGWGEPENAYFDRTDIFAVKLSGNGNLIWNTFAGSGNYEGAWAAVACDADILTLVGYSDGIQAPEPARDLSGGVDGTVLKFATPAAEPELTEGDANLDGATNVIDAMFIAQYTVGLRELDATQLLCADTTDDGLVNVIDAMHVAQFTVDPHGDGGILCKPLWETPADDRMLNPLGL